jgi:hypothetical protein
MINLVTKDEVMTNIEGVIYRDSAKVFYHYNGTLTQLALSEDTIIPKVFELTFNKQEGFEITDILDRDKYFTTAKVLNVSRSIMRIPYNDINSGDMTYNNAIGTSENDMRLAESTIAMSQHVIDCMNDGDNLTTYRVIDGSLDYIMANPTQRIYDFRQEEEVNNTTMVNIVGDSIYGTILTWTEGEV